MIFAHVEVGKNLKNAVDKKSEEILILKKKYAILHTSFF